MHGLDLGADALIDILRGVTDEAVKVAHVAAGHEMIPRTLDDHASDRRVRGERGGRIPQAVGHLRVQRVQHFGTIKGNGCNAIVDGRGNMLGHV